MAKRYRTPLRERIRVLCSQIDALRSAIDRQLDENERRQRTFQAGAEDENEDVTVFECGRARKL